MAMVQIIPTEISVACDPFTGRPRAVRIGDEQADVITIERVRDETAAYPADRGPRTVFVVRTRERRLRLAFQHWTRRWVVEGVDPQPEVLASAA